MAEKNVSCLSNCVQYFNTSVNLVTSEWNNIRFTVPILVDINAPLTSILVVMYANEFIFSIIGVVCVIYFTHFVRNFTVLHKNLTNMMTIGAVLYVLGLLSRWYLLMVQMKWITDLNTLCFLLAGFLRFHLYGSSISIIPVIALERTFATYYIMDYESENRSWITILCGIFSIIFAFSLTIPIIFFSFTLVSIASLSLSGAIIGNITLLIIFKYNSRELMRLKNWRFENKFQSRNVQYTLGKKFQIEENIRITKGLMLIGLLLIILISIVLFIMYLPSISTSNDSSSQYISASFDFCLALASIAIPIICLCFLNAQKKIFKINVAPITVKSCNETNQYFDQLRQSWG